MAIDEGDKKSAMKYFKRSLKVDKKYHQSCCYWHFSMKKKRALAEEQLRSVKIFLGLELKLSGSFKVSSNFICHRKV